MAKIVGLVFDEPVSEPEVATPDITPEITPQAPENRDVEPKKGRKKEA